MPLEGFTAEECLDFDFGVVDFWEFIEQRQAERTPVPETSEHRLPNNGKGWTWGPKYPSMQEIFDLYTHGRSDPDALDPDVEEIDIEASITQWFNESRVGLWDDLTS